MVGSWISQIISLLGTYVTWLFTLNIAENISVGESILFFAVALLIIIFIKRLAHAGAYNGDRSGNSSNSNSNKPEIPF